MPCLASFTDTMSGVKNPTNFIPVTRTQLQQMKLQIITLEITGVDAFGERARKFYSR